MMKAQLIHAKADLRFTLQNYNFSTNPQGGWRKLYYNELLLVVCFTRITVNVPRIAINWLFYTNYH